MKQYRVWHRTAYNYSAPVEDSVGQFHLIPRELPGQRVREADVVVSPAPGDPLRTLWRERLVIGGAAAPALWPVLWATWQWRGARLRALAPTWAHDPEPEASV